MRAVDIGKNPQAQSSHAFGRDDMEIEAEYIVLIFYKLICGQVAW